MQTVSLVVGFLGNNQHTVVAKNFDTQTKLDIENKFRGSLTTPQAATEFLKKFVDPFDFEVCIKRNDVYCYVKNTWELVLFGNRLFTMTKEAIHMFQDILNAVNAFGFIKAFDDVKWIGHKITKNDTIRNVMYSMVGSVPSLAPAAISQTGEILNYIVPVVLTAFTIFGILSLAIYIRRRRYT